MLKNKTIYQTKPLKKFSSPGTGLSLDRGLLFFRTPGGGMLCGSEETKCSISHGDTLSGLLMEAGSSH